jgi:tryptophan 2,3-dioxygenase
MKALSYKDVNLKLMKKLEEIHKTSKTKRVLFIKDHDTDEILIKILPNLPEEESQTECNVEEDYDSEFSSLTKTKRIINSSFC